MYLYMLDGEQGKRIKISIASSYTMLIKSNDETVTHSLKNYNGATIIFQSWFQVLEIYL